jgi:hypothetical protein
MPKLEELELWPHDDFANPLDFSKMLNLKRLAIYNKQEDSTFDLRTIIGGDNKLAQLSLTHFYAAEIQADNDMDFFKSLPLTLETIGWFEWINFSTMFWEKEDIKNFFLDRRVQGAVRVSGYYAKPNDLHTLLGTYLREDDVWQWNWSTKESFHKFLGCSQPWALK